MHESNSSGPKASSRLADTALASDPLRQNKQLVLAGIIEEQTATIERQREEIARLRSANARGFTITISVGGHE